MMFCWRNWVICLIEFCIFWIWLTASSSCHLPCSTVPGAWWATVHRFAKRQTRLKWLRTRARTVPVFPVHTLRFRAWSHSGSFSLFIRGARLSWLWCVHLSGDTQCLVVFPFVLLASLMIIAIWMWKLDYKEGWALKNWCFWIVVLKKTPESSLDSMEIKPTNPKGNAPWIFIGKTDVKSRHIEKEPDAGKDWG